MTKSSMNANGLAVGILLAVLTVAVPALASERDIKFTNKSGQDANDLHIVFSQHTTVKSKGDWAGDKSTGSNDTTHNFYGTTVKADDTAAKITLTSTVNTLTIGKWWLTTGGTANMDGTQIGPTNTDTGGATLSFLGPASGDGVIAVAINGLAHEFDTVAGDTAEQSVLSFDTFMNSLVDGTFQLINSTLVSPTSDTYVGNLLGDPATELNVSVLRADTTQEFLFSPIPEPSSLIGGAAGIAGLVLRRSRRLERGSPAAQR